MNWLTYVWEMIEMVWTYHWSIPVIFLLFVIWPLTNWSVMRNPRLIINGFMDMKKGKDIAPEIFGNPED